MGPGGSGGTAGGQGGSTGGAQGTAGAGPRPAQLALEPATGSSANYGNVPRGESVDATFTLSNTGEQSTTAITGGLTGTDFSVLPPSGADCVPGMVLAGGGSCPVRVRFAPSASTARSGLLTAGATTGGYTQLTLMGTGVPSLEVLAGAVGGPGNADATGASARFTNPEAVTSDGAGNLFVADTGNHTIRKVVIATGVVTTLAGVAGKSGQDDGTGAGARFNFPPGITSDGAGNLFVLDRHAPPLRKVVITTGEVTTPAVSIGALMPPLGITSDGAGSLFTSGANGYAIQRVVIATGAVTRLAGGDTGYVDGTGNAARFANPCGITSDGAGNLFVADTSTNTIRKVVIDTAQVTTLAGTAGMPGSSDGTGATARFSYPYGIVSDGASNLLVADSGNNTIRKVAIVTGMVTTLAGAAGVTGSADGTGVSARFNSPYGITRDGAGNVFVADRNNHAIRKVAIATGLVTTLAGAAGAAPGSADGNGASVRFSVPLSVTSDGAGSLFVADTDNHAIRKVVIATGAVTTLAGTVTVGGNADGTGAAAGFRSPSLIASDGKGNLFVADSGNQAIRKVVIATGEVTTLASPAVPDGGAGTSFSGLSGMTSNGAGTLFVARAGTISKVGTGGSEAGKATLLVGSETESGSADGTGAAARFKGITGLTSDGVGNLFVADSGSGTIRKVVLATSAVSTVAGTAGHLGVSTGPLPASLSRPAAVLALPTGELVVTDSGVNAILIVRF